ncbi:MAG: DUF2961 domain-containing protein, partial [Candidatus Hydrogenedentes bacterium]|nr:DUF2961 domain-containing protein [Candidatus Hydrogenedentota bacterium]
IWIEAESRDTEFAKKMPIECCWDDENDPSVSVVMADMFGTRNSNGDFRSLPIGNRDGQMYCYMPMPFRNHAVIKTRNPSREKVVIKVWISWRSMDRLPDNMIMFHAQTRKSIADEGQDISVLDAEGRGQYVGCIMSAASTTGTKFMEGDEKMFVDGELTPSLHGTGTADYFNSSSRFSAGTFTTATHGVPFLNKTTGDSWFTGYRFHITDYVPFRKSFHMEFEHGPENDAPGTVYYTTAFWYQTEPHLALGVNTVAPPPPPAPAKRVVKIVERYTTALERAAAAKRKSESQQAGPGVIELAPVVSQPEPAPPAAAVQ